MSISLVELLPAIATLSHAEKFQLVQLVLAQLAQEDGIEIKQLQQPVFSPSEIRSQATLPRKSLRGCLKQYAQPNLIAQEQNIWQTVVSKNR
jgi:predicted transcriptional regulator